MEFNITKIEKLIVKYNAVTTTLDEEQYLQQYFTTQQVPQHLQQYMVLFSYYKEAKKEVLNTTILLPNKKINYRWLSIAGAFILAVGFYAQYTFTNTKKQDKAVLLAYQQTKMALQLLSNNLNNGTEKVLHLSNFENITNQIFKNNNQ